MFNQITIERFRGIRYAHIEGFRPINLFFGKNNCGKSTLLEAVFLASGLSNPLLPLSINGMRGYSKSRLNDIKLHFHNLDTSHPIHIKMVDGAVRDLSISLLVERQESVALDGEGQNMISTTDDGKYGLQYDFKINSEPHVSQLRFDATQPTTAMRQIDETYVESLQCVYLSPKYDFRASLDGLKKILQNKDERFITEALKIIEPAVRDFIFVDGDVLVDIGLNERVPINVLGDGARKIVSLLTSVYYCENGVLLIDEISNGFHHSVMSKLWKVLIAASVRNNTQLFVTTHDIDSIKGLRDAAIDTSDATQIAAFKLLRTKDDEIKSFFYSLSSVDYSLNQEIEIR